MQFPQFPQFPQFVQFVQFPQFPQFPQFVQFVQFPHFVRYEPPSMCRVTRRFASCPSLVELSAIGSALP